MHLSTPHVSKRDCVFSSCTCMGLHDEAFRRKSNSAGTAKTNHSRVQLLLGQGWSAVGCD